MSSPAGKGAGAGVFGLPVPTTVGDPPPSCAGHEGAVKVATAGVYEQPS